MTLKLRNPTGRTGFPVVLVEGTDKAGKSWSLAKLSASPKVGRTAVLILGESESRWDEYGKISGARFKIAEHDGSWPSIMGVVEDAKEEAAADLAAGKPPFVLGIDSTTAEWDGLKDWASLRARGSKKNRALLEADPNAEIDVTSNFWNDARARHRAFMRPLLTFPGIVVLCARGGEVTLFENGKPVANRKTWTVESEKNLPFDVSVHIRLSRDARPLLISASSVTNGIRPGIDPPRRLGDDWSLEGVIFDTLGLDSTAQAGKFPEFRQQRTPEEIRDEALTTTTTPDRLRELYREAAASKQLGISVENETGDTEELKHLLIRLAGERDAAPPARPVGRAPVAAAPEPPGPAVPDETPASGPAASPGTTTAQEPTAPAGEPVTDMEWMTRLAEFRIPEASTLAAITRFRAEVTQKERAGQCSPEYAQQLRIQLDERSNELGLEPAGAVA
jgi:hypothetical protein